jgi:hypothetical protein
LSDVVANILYTYVKSFAVKRMPSKKKKYNARFPAVSFALCVKEMLIMCTLLIMYTLFTLLTHIYTVIILWYDVKADDYDMHNYSYSNLYCFFGRRNSSPLNCVVGIG